jgi:hypothetical protein
LDVLKDISAEVDGFRHQMVGKLVCVFELLKLNQKANDGICVQAEHALPQHDISAMSFKDESGYALLSDHVSVCVRVRV